MANLQKEKNGKIKKVEQNSKKILNILPGKKFKKQGNFKKE